jgi:hypothetical protein
LLHLAAVFPHTPSPTLSHLMEPESSSSLATVPSTIVEFDNEGKLVSLMLLFRHLSFTFISLTSPSSPPYSHVPTTHFHNRLPLPRNGLRQSRIRSLSHQLSEFRNGPRQPTTT